MADQNTLKGWTKEEKLELLEALRDVGSFNIGQIKEFVSNKSVDEIKEAIDFYRKKASARPPTPRKKERKLTLPVAPLSQWAKFIVDTHGFEELQTDTAAALRLIADFEDKPPALCTEKIDFKKVYHMLADAFEGKPLQTDKYILALFDKCIVETALTSRAFNKGSTGFKQILQSSCNPTTADVNAFSQPTQDKELVTLRYLSSKKNYNPLNVPEKGLKLSIYSM